MKTRMLSVAALLVAGALVLSGCNKTENSAEEQNAEMANPASVYCEENGGTLQLEEGAGLCMFADGSYCEEWAYYREECQPGEIIYNTISEDEDVEENESEVAAYTQEDLASAETTIRNYFENEMTVKVENLSVTYLGDEKSASELDYCKSLDAEIEECSVFTTDFYIPEQDVEMAGAFEPNTTITGYQWYLGRNAGGEWKILTMGY